MSVNEFDASKENGGHNRTSEYLSLISNLEMVATFEIFRRNVQRPTSPKLPKM
jgi:hypothetical protein